MERQAARNGGTGTLSEVGTDRSGEDVPHSRDCECGGAFRGAHEQPAIRIRHKRRRPLEQRDHALAGGEGSGRSDPVRLYLRHRCTGQPRHFPRVGASRPCLCLQTPAFPPQTPRARRVRASASITSGRPLRARQRLRPAAARRSFRARARAPMATASLASTASRSAPGSPRVREDRFGHPRRSPRPACRDAHTLTSPAPARKAAPRGQDGRPRHIRFPPRS